MDYLEIQFWKIAKYIIKKGYGADCIDDYSPLCSSCRAMEVMEWIDGHIDLLKM